MELRHLRYLIAVADAGSLSAAASRVHVTQPSLSRQMRALERELGVGLFSTTQRSTQLSAAGRRFLPFARDLVARADAAVAAAHTLASGRLEHLTIAAPGTTLTDVIAPFLALLEEDDPMPTVWEELPVSVYAALPRGADLAIGTTPPAPHLASVALADLPVWAYVRGDDPWAGRSDVGLGELVSRDLLLLSGDFHPRRALDQALGRSGRAYESVVEVGTPEVAQALAAAGRGVAVLSDDPRFGLRPLRITAADGPVHISLYAAWQRDHHAAATLEALAERLTAFCVERYGPEVAPALSRR
ncbi:LysR family transcriptional regulator [Lapillicoccus jejuensis]|uniref:DNA-binding transcriptional LysR family regulator n=1 Tax=Lapillicoccus jejuensis TaxID=402171 RepID=A0A542E3N8_9MICO|nr:LysR family transcriptional regulator [Lapillicoccus jejuensis]TQJ09896.1 DNA-binding transcriptional LysR family regulator [Lapillicoccus jejuensis]